MWIVIRSLRQLVLGFTGSAVAEAARAVAMIALVASLTLPHLAIAQVGIAPPIGQQGVSNETPDQIKGLDVVEHLGQKLDLNMVFTGSDGKPVQLREVFADGKPVVLQLVYFRCPMQCPLILQRFNQRLRELDWTVGEKFNVVVVSFDPTETADSAAKEKIAAMLSYDRSPQDKISAGWFWLTSNTPGQTQKLADQVGFQYRYLPASNEYAHPTVTFVLSPDGMISRYLYGIDTPVRDLRLALLEASEGKIGNTVDRVLMFCFHFDPSKGGYVASAFRVMQVASVGMVLFVLSVILVMLVVEWRRRAGHAAARAAAGRGAEAGVVQVINSGVAAHPRGTGTIGAV
jgi:protein SCO1